MSDNMKQARNSEFKYSKQSREDMDKVCKLVSDAWHKGIELGYNPHDIFYEIVTEANTKFLMLALSMQK